MKIALGACACFSSLVLAREHFWYVKESVASPDGYPRRVIVVMDRDHMNISQKGDDPYNDRLVYESSLAVPGPVLHVRHGERVVVHVQNEMPTSELSIHWHGIHMLSQAWMDGTPGVTGCSIPPNGGSAVYNFTVTQEPGTHWWHSHAGAQYADGVYGVIIIDPEEGASDPVWDLMPYDLDQVVTIQDWSHETYYDLSARYRSRSGAFTQTIRNKTLPFLPDYPYPSSHILINGRGQTDCIMKLWRDCEMVRLKGWASYFNHSSKSASETPLVHGLPTGTAGQCLPERPPLMGECNPAAHPSRLRCVPSGSVRLRLVNTGYSMPLRFWIDRHTFFAVARDGTPVRPNGPHHAIVLNVGQRIDIVVICDQAADQSYQVFAMVALREFYPGAHRHTFEASSYAVLDYNMTDESDMRVGPTAFAEPRTSPEHFEQPGLTQGCNIGCNYRHRIYTTWNISPTEYVPFAIESRLRPIDVKQTKDMLAPAAQDRLYVSVSGRGNWWNNMSDAHQHFGLKFEWWSMNEGVNWTNSRKPLSTPLEPIMLGRLFGRSIADLFGTEDPRKMPYVQTLEYSAESPLTYEVVFLNYEGQQHSWHLHGHSVHVVEQGWLDPKARWRGNLFNASHVDLRGIGVGRRSAQPATSLARLDTFTLGPHAYIIFRLTANNPGAWMMHCHMDFHLEVGMGMIWSVEAPGGGGYLLPPPPSNFRMCGQNSVYTSTGAAHSLTPAEPMQLSILQELAQLKNERLLYRVALIILTCACAYLGFVAWVRPGHSHEELPVPWRAPNSVLGSPTTSYSIA